MGNEDQNSIELHKLSIKIIEKRTGWNCFVMKGRNPKTSISKQTCQEIKANVGGGNTKLGRKISENPGSLAKNLDNIRRKTSNRGGKQSH